MFRRSQSPSHDSIDAEITANKFRSSPPTSFNKAHDNDDNSNDTIMPPLPPSPDLFMSDSPQSRPPQSINGHYVDEGLHHRISSSNSSRVVTHSQIIHHRTLPQHAVNSGNGNFHNGTIIRPSRLFHSYNPYHNGNMRQSGGGKFTISFAWALRCLFFGLVLGYVSLLIYTHALWSQEGDDGYSNNSNNNRDHDVESREMYSAGGVRSSSLSSSSNHDVYEEHSRHNIIDTTDEDNDVNNAISKNVDEISPDERDDYRIVSLHDLFLRTRRRHARRGSDNQNRQPTTSSEEDHSLGNMISINSFDSNTDDENQKKLDMARRVQEERRQNRKLGTTPPLLAPSTQYQQHTTQQEMVSDVPGTIWYNLEHSSDETMSRIQKRWEDTESDSTNDDQTTTLSSSSLGLDTSRNLCGKYAQQASIHHPHNYYPPSSTTTTQQRQQQQHVPLNSQSKVLITGILSPLGFHLTLALHRQCNITNFIGIDSQIPNDQLNRLEMQDRLEVLLNELSPNDGQKERSSSTSVKSLWYVPFLGLEPKHSKSEPLWKVEERERREELLVKMRNHPHHYIIDGASDKEGVSSLLFGTRRTGPYEKYGIPMSPGVNADGYGTLDIIAEYRPTHIVHLARTQSDSLLNSKRHDPHQMKDDNDDAWRSVSSRPHLYESRMGMVGMEQLLSSVVAQSMIPPSSDMSLANPPLTTFTPHVVYASSYDARYFSETAKRQSSQHQHHGNKEIMLGEGEQLTIRKHNSPPRGFHGVSHLIDEILASTYHGLHGISAIGLRFDAIYGPRGFGAPSTSVPILNVNRMRGNVGVSPDVALAEVEVRRMYRKWMQMIDGVDDKEEKNEPSLIEESGWSYASHHSRDFVFVEDAVGAIMAAMQYRAVQGSPTTFNIGSGEMNTLSAFADKIQQVAFDDKRRNKSVPKSVIDVERLNAASSASYTANEYLGWSAETKLKVGVAKLLAWHLDRALPLFPSSTLSDEEVDYSGNEGAVKHMDGKELLLKNNVESCSDPSCLVEKHTSYPCASECSTMTCAPSIFDNIIPLVQDTTDGCYMVLYTAPLGYDVESLDVETEYSDSGTTFEYHEGTVCTIAFVPSESTLVKNVIDELPANALSMLDTSSNDSYSTKLKKLNGHLAHKGWLLVFVDNATHPLPPEEVLIPKLAPAHLFHSSVRRAMYVDESFAHTPSPEDALFLATETYRGVTKSRTIKGPDAKGRQTKYKLPEEPQRYAVILASKIRDILFEEGHKISLRDATRAMMSEKGYEVDAREPKELKAQREFYERSRSLINSMDLRYSDFANNRHRIEINDFIRSQWVLYNLKLEEGHQVRCEWYREHSHWAGSNTLDSGMDQLSFAYVMAKRELTRKIVSREPLPKELSLSEKVIKAATDAHEWHPVPLYSVKSSTTAKEVPLNIADRPEFEVEKAEPEKISDDSETSYYVRIMSDEVMMRARKNWSKFVAKFEKK